MRAAQARNSEITLQKVVNFLVVLLGCSVIDLPAAGVRKKRAAFRSKYPLGEPHAVAASLMNYYISLPTSTIYSLARLEQV